MLQVARTEATHWCISKWNCISIQRLVAGSTAHSHRKSQAASQARSLETPKMANNLAQTTNCRTRRCLPNRNFQLAWLSRLNQHLVPALKLMRNVLALNFSHVETAWLSRISSTILLASWRRDRNYSMIIRTPIALKRE